MQSALTSRRGVARSAVTAMLALAAGRAAAQLAPPNAAQDQDLPRLPDGLEVVAKLQQPPGNVAVTPEGRIILSQHQYWNPTYRVMELKPGGRLVPFPNEDWSLPPSSATDPGLVAVLGLRSDPDGIVWMLDNAQQGGRLAGTPKLLGWDTRQDRMHALIALPPPATVEDSFLNDLAIDAQRGTIVISDPAGGGNAALVVVDLRTRQARRVLQGHASVTPQEIPLTIDGQVIIGQVGGRMRNRFVGVDAITIDPGQEHVYFGSLNGRTTWRVPAAALADPDLGGDALARQIERYAERPPSDGQTIDSAGNLYVTDIGNHAIGVATPNGYRILFQDDTALSWPDGFSAGPDNDIYVTVNRLHESPVLSPARSASGGGGATDQPRAPTWLLRFKALAPIPVGR